ncbi:MAG: hypothetical protein WC322_00060 [Candidatus Paceibacterota bacterium]|jgi:hypothetical protein
MTQFEQQAQHLTTLATTPGWWEYTRQRVRELDKEPGFEGIHAEVTKRIKASGYKPDMRRERVL